MALFAIDGFVVRALQRDDLPALQALFEANPDYFLRVGGQPPRPEEARLEFDELPPPHLTYTERWFAGLFDEAGPMHGLLVVVSDLAAPGVWHIALLLLDDATRGTGVAPRLHTALEDWARSRGARWLRLAVIRGNTPAERFWARCGYEEVRTRPHVNASGQTLTARVLVKPLAGGTRADYLTLVPRDAPGSPLP